MISGAKLRVPVSEKDHVYGTKDALLELVEYGDYECPFCGQVFDVIKRLQETFSKDLKFVFRNFPLTQIHPDSMNAARAAEAAGLQHKFWEMHDMLYENQDRLDEEHLLSYAVALKLNLKRFAKDFADKKVDEKILSDLENGARSGVNGTPNFYINGYRYSGDWSYESMSSVLRDVHESLLQRELKRAS